LTSAIIHHRFPFKFPEPHETFSQQGKGKSSFMSYLKPKIDLHFCLLTLRGDKRIAAIKALLMAEADPKAVDGNGDAPRQCAIKKRRGRPDRDSFDGGVRSECDRQTAASERRCAWPRHSRQGIYRGSVERGALQDLPVLHSKFCVLVFLEFRCTSS
jgi:hypothetical protein